MQQEKHNSILKIFKDLFQNNNLLSQLLLGVIVILTIGLVGLLLYIGFMGLYTIFTRGELPLLHWQTNCNITASILLVVFLIMSYKILEYYKDKFIPIIQSQKRGYGYLPVLIIGASLQLYLILIAITAWFPREMIFPLKGIKGGIWKGILFTIIVLLISIIGKSYATRLSEKLQGKLIIKDNPRKIEPGEADLKDSYYSISVLKILRPEPNYLYQYGNVRDFEFAIDYDLLYVSDDTHEITITQVHPPGLEKLTLNLSDLGIDMEDEGGAWEIEITEDKTRNQFNQKDGLIYF